MTYESGRQNYHLDRLSTELYDGILCVDAPIEKRSKPVLLYPPDITENDLKANLA